MKIAYTYVAIDIFHYGHLRLLKSAREAADYHVCGLLTDDICRGWNGNLVMTYDERVAILDMLDCVDDVMKQDAMDPTENLKRIHANHPDAEILLFQGHQDWKGMPGTQYVESIGGRVIRPEYYPRLSRQFIREELNRSDHTAYRDVEGYVLGNLVLFTPYGSTKADTLRTLQPLLKKSTIEKLFVFTKDQWQRAHDKILERVRNEFEGKIVVRSSAQVEDSLTTSFAGFFHSALNVDAQDSASITSAVNDVIASYAKHDNNSIHDQILIQSQTDDVLLSGVLFTRNLNNAAPYYLINYELSQNTEAVTKGLAAQKLEIARTASIADCPPPWRAVLEAVQEIEAHLHDLTLDIEFAVKRDGQVVLFQVRPLAANARYDDVPDQDIAALLQEIKAAFEHHRKASLNVDDFALSDMSFWNPAEIIGDRASYLATSLYRYLILHRAWNDGLTQLGYRRVEGSLLVTLGDKPYIDVPKAFAALLPQSLNEEVAGKIISHYLARLREQPSLHDKIEFELVHNIFAPLSADRLADLEAVLSVEERKDVEAAFIVLTQDIFDSYDAHRERDLTALAELSRRRECILSELATRNPQAQVGMAMQLLDDARTLGTPQFSRMARMAFVANLYLKDLIRIGVLEPSVVAAFLERIETVASDFDRDFTELVFGGASFEAFVERYGHLRPGTYDITRLPYAKNHNYFSVETPRVRVPDSERRGAFDRNDVIERLGGYLKDFSIKLEPEFLLRFIEETTQFRELFKFEFTKNLSLALEIVAEVGQALGFERGDLKRLSVESLKGVDAVCGPDAIQETWQYQIQGRKSREELYQYMALPSLLFEVSDLDYVRSFSARPNFIGQEVVTGELVDLETMAPEDYSQVTGRIVMIEQADPGYDWIFSKGIKGLITRFGGAASHMAIRCAEFGIPAAIGCGEMISQNLKGQRAVRLDGQNQSIEVLR